MPYTVFGDYHRPGCGINNTSSHQLLHLGHRQSIYLNIYLLHPKGVE
jgi:hypothetical protein